MVLTSHADADARALAADATRTLIAWAANLQAQDIPDAVLRRAALVLSDNLAATVAADAEPEVQAAQAKLTERSIAQEATVFNRAAARVDRYAAAAANGTAATWCELDEGYRLAPAHAGVYILPALLAEAEAMIDDTPAYTRSCRDFHLAVAEASHNRVLVTQLISLQHVSWPTENRTLTPQVARRVLSVHRELAALIEMRDGAGARHLMDDHVKMIRARRVAEHAHDDTGCC